MDSFNPPFVPLFDLAIHIIAFIDTRIARIHKREYEVYGERIMIYNQIFNIDANHSIKAMCY